MLPVIEGLQYIADYLAPEAQDQLLEAVDRHPWLLSVDRRVQIYGYRYNHAKLSAFRIGDLPLWASELAVRLWRDGLLSSVPDQLVVNEYQPGSGIFAHVDPPVFGDSVVSVSLGSTCVIRFTDAASTRTEEILLEPRSALVLAGEARWRWKHEIPAQRVDVWRTRELPRSRRISLTFRVMPPLPPDP